MWLERSETVLILMTFKPEGHSRYVSSLAQFLTFEYVSCTSLAMNQTPEYPQKYGNLETDKLIYNERKHGYRRIAGL